MLPGNDRSILEAFRRGDPSVLTQVYRTYSPDVLRFLSQRFTVRGAQSTYAVALPPLDLDSAHQETFVRAFRPPMRQAYDGVRPYLGFLLTVARTTAIDLMRASGRIGREAVPIEDAPELQQLPMGGRSPEEEALDSEVRTLVRRFLEGLTEEAQALARLRFMEGISQEAVAERLNLTRGEVRVRERRLRAQFTEHLKASGWLDDVPEHGLLRVGVVLATAFVTGFRSIP